MDQKNYEIKFDGANSAGKQFDGIRHALEECSAKLAALSREMQSGFESEAARLAYWAEVIGQRAEAMQGATICLLNTTENYREAEKSAYNRITDAEGASDYGSPEGGGSGSSGNTGSDNTGNTDAGDAGSSGSGSSGDRFGEGGNQNTSESGTGFSDRDGIGYTDSDPIMPGFPPGFDFWGASDEERIQWWENLPQPLQWLYIMPMVLALSQSGGHSPSVVWNFIQDLINKKAGKGAQDGERENEDENALKGNIEEGGNRRRPVTAQAGSAVIDRPASDFSEAESHVNARAGLAASAVGLSSAAIDPTDTDEEVIADTSAEGEETTDITSGEEVAAEAAEDGEEAAEVDADGEGAAENAAGGGGMPARAIGGAGATSAAGSFFEGENEFRGLRGGFEDSANEIVSGEIVSDVENIDYAEENAVSVPAASGANSPVLGERARDRLFASEGKSSMGLAAPLIGAAAMGSVAATGVGMSKALNKDEDAGAEEQPLPVVEAKKSGGLFSGNLNGKYVLLATTFALSFAGLSVAAGVRKKREEEPDDRFRIGYGVSAILSGSLDEHRALDKSLKGSD